jgi:hypothetical protein
MPKTSAEFRPVRSYHAKCLEEMRDTRAEYQMSGVSRTRKMTVDQIGGLHRYLVERGFRTMTDICSYDGMFAAARALCRWPRPSELGTMAVRFAGGPIKYHRLVMNILSGTRTSIHDIGNVVGQDGENLIKLTEQHNLMYAWVHSSREGGWCKLYMYALDPADLDAAGAAAEKLVKSKGLVVGDKWKMEARELNPSAKEWLPAKRRPLNPNAKEFVPAKRRPLNPNAKEFVPAARSTGRSRA